MCWAPWIPQRRNRPGASLCLSVLEFHINGITPYALCWLFKNSEWCLAVIRGVARTSSFLSSVVSLCIVVGLRIHLLLDVWVVSSLGSVNKALRIIHGQVVWCPLCSFLLALYLGVEPTITSQICLSFCKQKGGARNCQNFFSSSRV